MSLISLHIDHFILLSGKTESYVPGTKNMADIFKQQKNQQKCTLKWQRHGQL